MTTKQFVVRLVLSIAVIVGLAYVGEWFMPDQFLEISEGRWCGAMLGWLLVTLLNHRWQSKTKE